MARSERRRAMARAVRLTAAVICLLTVGGCATTTGVAHAAKESFTYATWDHFAFSVKSNWQIFHYWNASATRRDAERAQGQGGWWGDEVPVVE